MADFLNNLLLRSAADRPTLASLPVLKPRLPSLFEPTTERAIPLDHALETESVAVTREPSMLASKSESPKAESPAIQQHSLVPSIKHVSSHESQQTIVPHVERESNLEIKTAKQEHEMPVVRASENILQAEPPALHAMPSDVRLSALEETRSSPYTNTKPMKAESPFEKAARPTLEPLTTKADMNPLAIMQPVSIPARAKVTQPSTPTREPEPQPVVEIHIGRIEVRASSAPVSAQTKPRSTAIMSLEDYLRSRTGDKR